jgi:XTP/dITP diphosphohydrolase
MVRRNPHVFAGETVADVDEIIANWERIKKAEKARGSALDGIALSQPALALAAKILQRAERAGLSVPLPPADDLGGRLLATVAAARAAGLDPEAELRRAALAHAAAVRAAEPTTKDPDADNADADDLDPDDPEADLGRGGLAGA